MGYENDPEFSYRDEDILSDRDEPQQHLLDSVDDSLYESPERSPTPVYNDSKGDDMVGLVRDDYFWMVERGKERKGRRGNLQRKTSKGEKREKKFKMRKSGGGRMRDHVADPEMKETWDTIAGGNSEDNQEGARTVDDDNFINDSGVGPADRYGSDNEHSPSRALTRF